MQMGLHQQDIKPLNQYVSLVQLTSVRYVNGISTSRVTNAYNVSQELSMIQVFKIVEVNVARFISIHILERSEIV